MELMLEQINKWYDGGTHAVKDLDLSVRDGEFMVFVGPSGCGKSTLLRMIAGLEGVDGGLLLMDGRPVNKVPPKDRDIAMVFQNYALYPHMSVFGNMAFPLKMRRWSRGDIRRRVEEVAEGLDLTQYLSRRPGQLSGGQRQRVALGRAMVRSPRLFLMDEPLSNLDAKLRVRMRREIVELQRSLGVTTIYVTHDQTEAMTMGTRIAIMRDGVLQQVDAPRDLYDTPANLFVARFIGSPPMNLWPGEALGLGGGVLAGVRPEHLSPGTQGDFTLRSRIEALEYTGRECIVYLSAQGLETFAMAAPSGFSGVAGDMLCVGVRREHVLLFDAGSGARLAAVPPC